MLQLKVKHQLWLDREEILWKQKLRNKWLKEGDANTWFFYVSVLNKKRRNMLTSLTLQDGSSLKTFEEIHNGAINFYQNLLAFEPVVRDEEVFSLIPKLVSEEDNVALLQPPSLKETKEKLDSIPDDSCLGPDGFLAAFFKVAWDIVHDNL